MGDRPDEKVYGDAWAEHYDERFSDFDPEAIDFLASLCEPPGRALELATGTGRIALPLAQRGIPLVGVDISPAMLDVLRSKPGSEQLTLVEGDMAKVAVEGSFQLVFVVFNSFFAMLTQGRQVECMSNVSRVLEPGGRFVLECFVPDMKRYDRHNSHIGVLELDSDGSHRFDMSLLDPISQRISSHQVIRNADGINLVLPVTLRYVWPAELDLMARLAGLVPEDRFGGFDRSEFTEESSSHVSVYRRPFE